MKLLALDTSTVACSVAVLNGDRTYVRYEEQAREHTRLLVPMIRESLHDAGIGIGNLDAIVLGNGPGSFIGMRIGAAVAQGLACGAGIQILPVSSMAAVAADAAMAENETVAVTQDAHMNEVYLGMYRMDKSGLPVSLAPERLQSRSAIDEIIGRDDIVAAGGGWLRYPDLLVANQEAIARQSDVVYPSAAGVMRLGVASFATGEGLAPEHLEPIYLRQKVAQAPVAAAP